MQGILDNLDVSLDKVSLENFIKDTITPLIDYATVNEIVKEIVYKIGAEPSSEQLDELKTSAEMLKISNLDFMDSVKKISQLSFCPRINNYWLFTSSVD